MLGPLFSYFVQLATALPRGFLSILFEADDYRLLSRIREGAVNGVRERVVIRTASLGSSGILIGSAELAFSKLISDPAGTALYNPNAIQR